MNMQMRITMIKFFLASGWWARVAKGPADGTEPVVVAEGAQVLERLVEDLFHLRGRVHDEWIVAVLVAGLVAAHSVLADRSEMRTRDAVVHGLHLRIRLAAWECKIEDGLEDSLSVLADNVLIPKENQKKKEESVINKIILTIFVFT